MKILTSLVAAVRDFISLTGCAKNAVGGKSMPYKIYHFN